MAAFEAVQRALYETLDLGLRERGARMTYFIGQMRADVPRPAPDSDPAGGAPRPAPE